MMNETVMRRFRVGAFVGVMLLGIMDLMGQSVVGGGQQDEPLPTPKRVFRLSCLGEWKGDELYVKTGSAGGGKSMKKVDLLDMGYSPPIGYKVGRPIEFYKKIEGSEKPYALELSVSLEPNMKKPLILLRPSGEKVVHSVFELDSGEFPYGSIKVINLSGKVLNVALDKDIKTLRLGQTVNYAPVKGKKVRAWLRIADVGTKKLVFSSMMMRRSAKRILMILEKGDDEAVPVRARMLVDFEQPEKVEG